MTVRGATGGVGLEILLVVGVLLFGAVTGCSGDDVGDDPANASATGDSQQLGDVVDLDGLDPQDAANRDVGVPEDTLVDAQADAAGAKDDATDAQDGDSSPADTPTHPMDSQSPDAAAPVKLGAPYPIVLAHGFFGVDKFAGLDFATYFFGVKADLDKKMGEKNVFTPAVDPFNSSTVRGKALLGHIKTILAKTGHKKVNIIGHSQGGLDARYVAHNAPELVATVVTVATPHHGSPIADIVLKLVPYPSAQAIIDAIVKLIGKPVYTQDGKTSSVSTALKQFSTAQAKAFNKANPNAPGVAYYSVTGRSGHALALADCKPDEGHDFVVKLKYNTDPIEPLLALAEAAIDNNVFKPQPNDGLVRVKDAKWGTFLGCVPADHMDEVGHLFGDKPGLLNPFDHKAMYRWLVKMVRLKGY
ncbi:MAG: alpha/beta fold hydrolase [Myxococcales bacterium]|nr:alpha/beta fold hydrolase [Myxococcales bacterium]